MVIDIISIVPDLLQSPLQHSIIHRAREKGLLEINVINLRDYGKGNYNQIDDYQYGGGSGMVIMVEPLSRCIEDLKKVNSYDEIIYLSPDGERLSQPMANSLSLKGRIMLICGHYKGIDHRIREKYVTQEISIGDYVLSGGETAAIVMVDAIGRLIPGVLNDETSALTDSFQDGLLSPPVYSRPAEYDGMSVPEVLLSGNDKLIEDWRYEQAIERTRKLRPDLLKE